MEHTSLAHLWGFKWLTSDKDCGGSDIDDEIHDPWAAIKQFGPTSDSGTDGQTKFATVGSFMESEFGFGNRKVKISNHKLTRKSVTGDCQDLVQGDAEGLDSDGNWKGFRIMICGRKFWHYSTLAINIT